MNDLSVASEHILQYYPAMKSAFTALESTRLIKQASGDFPRPVRTIDKTTSRPGSVKPDSAMNKVVAPPRPQAPVKQAYLTPFAAMEKDANNLLKDTVDGTWNATMKPLGNMAGMAAKGVGNMIGGNVKSMWNVASAPTNAALSAMGGAWNRRGEGLGGMVQGGFDAGMNSYKTDFNDMRDGQKQMFKGVGQTVGGTLGTAGMMAASPYTSMYGAAKGAWTNPSNTNQPQQAGPMPQHQGPSAQRPVHVPSAPMTYNSAGAGGNVSSGSLTPFAAMEKEASMLGSMARGIGGFFTRNAGNAQKAYKTNFQTFWKGLDATQRKAMPRLKARSGFIHRNTPDMIGKEYGIGQKRLAAGGFFNNTANRLDEMKLLHPTAHMAMTGGAMAAPAGGLAYWRSQAGGGAGDDPYSGYYTPENPPPNWNEEGKPGASQRGVAFALLDKQAKGRAIMTGARRVFQPGGRRVQRGRKSQSPKQSPAAAPQVPPRSKPGTPAAAPQVTPRSKPGTPAAAPQVTPKQIRPRHTAAKQQPYDGRPMQFESPTIGGPAWSNATRARLPTPPGTVHRLEAPGGTVLGNLLTSGASRLGNSGEQAAFMARGRKLEELTGALKPGTKGVAARRAELEKMKGMSGSEFGQKAQIGQKRLAGADLLHGAGSKINAFAAENPGLWGAAQVGAAGAAGGGALYGANRMGHSSGREQGVEEGLEVGQDRGIAAAMHNMPGDPGVLGRILEVFRGQQAGPDVASLRGLLNNDKADVLKAIINGTAG